MTIELAVILVYSTSHAIKIERALRDAGIDSKLIPVPRQLSSDCGVCVRIERAQGEAARQIIAALSLEIDGIHAVDTA
jgi:hypothetical protein